MQRNSKKEFVGLRLVEWNARSILSRYNELLSHSTKLNFFLISETWLQPQNDFIIKRFDTVRKDRDKRQGGGVMILINHKYKYREITGILDCGGKIEACGVEVFHHGELIFLVSCYRPPNSVVISEEEWKSFLG